MGRRSMASGAFSTRGRPPTRNVRGPARNAPESGRTWASSTAAATCWCAPFFWRALRTTGCALWNVVTCVWTECASITASQCLSGYRLQPFFRYSNKRRGIDTDFNNGRRAIRGRTGEPARSEVGEHRVNILRKRDLDGSAVRRRFHQCRFKSQQVLESRNRKRIGIHESAESDYFVGGKSDRRCDRYVAVKKIAQRLRANSDQEQACCVFEEFRNRAGPK